MYVAFPDNAGLDTFDVAELLDKALRIHLHLLDIKFYLRVQSTAPLEDTVKHYQDVAEIDRNPFEQAKHGAVWGARCLRDEFVVHVACLQILSFQKLASAMDRQLSHTSSVHLGFSLEPEDPRTSVRLDAYFPVPPDGPRPFWIGVAWGMTKYANYFKLALEARRNGPDILDSWFDFQLATPAANTPE